MFGGIPSCNKMRIKQTKLVAESLDSALTFFSRQAIRRHWSTFSNALRELYWATLKHHADAARFLSEAVRVDKYGISVKKPSMVSCSLSISSRLPISVLNALHSTRRAATICLTMTVRRPRWVQGRERNTGAAVRLTGLFLSLVDPAAKLAVHVSAVGIEAAKMLMHDLYFALEHLILFLRITCVVYITAEAADFVLKAHFLLLRASDVVNSCKYNIS